MENLNVMQQIGAVMRTQDNLGTAEPFFTVQEKRRVYGVDSSYTDSFVWINTKEFEEVGSEEAVTLEAQYRRDLDSEPDGYRRGVGYSEYWAFVTGSFTLKGAKDFIEGNSNRYKGALRVYVESLYRNREMIAVRAALMSLADDPVAVAA